MKGHDDYNIISTLSLEDHDSNSFHHTSTWRQLSLYFTKINSLPNSIRKFKRHFCISLYKKDIFEDNLNVSSTSTQGRFYIIKLHWRYYQIFYITNQDKIIILINRIGQKPTAQEDASISVTHCNTHF